MNNNICPEHGTGILDHRHPGGEKPQPCGTEMRDRHGRPICAGASSANPLMSIACAFWFYDTEKKACNSGGEEATKSEYSVCFKSYGPE